MNTSTTRALSFALPWVLLAGCGEVPPPAPVEVAAHAPDEDLPGGAPEVEHHDPRAGTWTAPLARIVERWKARAVQEGRGKLDAGDVEVSVHVTIPGASASVELAALEADVARGSASNMKLVTTAAALVLLGAERDFMTAFDAVGEVRGGRLAGDLVARAAGDPLVRIDGDARIEDRLDPVVEGLRAHDILSIAGDLVLDEGTFEEPGPAPGWPDASQYWQAHCALSGGFSVNGGVLQARILPGAVGAHASVGVHPSPHGLRSDVGVKTVANKLDVRVGASATTVTVRGEIPAWKELYTPEFAHPDPVALFGCVLRDRLERAGIELAGGVVRRRGVGPGQRVAEIYSSVDATLVPINTHSRNSVADQLFLALGQALEGEGTRAAAARATRRALEGLGVPTEGFHQADGSGLSRDNRVSARQLTALLAGVLARGDVATRLYLDSLAVAGESGTLEERMRAGSARGRVRAKTGWITGVSSLSGYCDTLAGERLVFAILVEYPPALSGMNTRVFKPMQDEILEELVEGGA